MLSSEFIKDQPDRMPHLYLDMDGVQADFFGAWSKYHNVPHWKAIKDRDKEIAQLAHSSTEEVYDFFRNLEPLSGGMLVVKYLKRHNIPFTVLSAPLFGPYGQACIQAKKDWLDEFNPGTSSSAIFTGNKFIYATDGQKNPNVLVDDFGKYLLAWKDAGGIPIKHEDEFESPDSGRSTIQKLQRIYKPFLENTGN